MEVILIRSFPLPPSENALYRNIPGVGRVATKELKDYRRECEMYGLKHAGMFREIKQTLSDRWKDCDHYKVDYYFSFKRERLYCKNGSVKKLDVANRVKAVQDCLCALLGRDDKHIFASMIEKMSGEFEFVHIVLAQHTPLNASELIEMFEATNESPKLLS